MQRTAIGAGVLSTLLIGYLLVGILVPPALPTWVMPRADTLAPAHATSRALASARQRARQRLLAALRRREPVAPLARETMPRATVPSAGHTAASRGRGAPIHAAFYVDWDDDAWQSLQQHVAQLDWVIAEWGFLHTDDLRVALHADPRVQSLIAAQPATRRPRLLAMITNVDSGGTVFSGARVRALVASPSARARFVDDVRSFVQAARLGGVVIDFEQVPEDARPGVASLLRALRTSLRPFGAVIAVTVAADEHDDAIRAWGHEADLVVGMLYDEHSERDDAGPVASQSWYQIHATRLATLVPPERLLLAVGTFGYEWTDAVPASRPPALTWAEAMAAAREHGVLPRWDRDALEPQIRWTDTDSTDHIVWFLDGATTWNALQVGTTLGVAGHAVWRLGAEDPTVWRVFGHGTRAGAWADLEMDPPGYGVALHGDGELLRVTSHPVAGRRLLAHDSASDLVTDERVLTLPKPWTVERRGDAHPHYVALTFDDGPDPTWTPMVLDTLRAHHAPATFFVIGERVQAHLALTRRIAREGHTLGSHTFTHPDLSRVSPFVTRLELDATARLLEAVTGTRTLLFRPPYFGDAEPTTIDELAPVEQATALGYVTAGVHIDSDDWKTPGSAQIVSRVLERRARGHIVLLHDGGGNRAQTIAAIGPIIDSLRARGDTIVPLSALVDAPAQVFTPPLPAESARRRWLAFSGYAMLSGSRWVLVTVMGAALLVGAVRLLVIAVLAVRQRHRRRAGAGADAAGTPFAPSVSVIVPAYREEAVIVATVQSLLQQDHAGPLEVIVVDDGSPDDTFAVARNTFAAEPRVVVLTKPNGGKASALNAGIARAHSDIIVALDADTVFAPDAIARLVAPLRDARVAAVAGNAKVGNRINLVTRWQALEYITSQNLERRAFEALDAITVVPGAIGAWRATAVREAGGFSGDTLAEDQDLTLALRRRGWRIAYADDAVAFTEAPDTLRALARQRFRWAFGTLQCAWKHRDTLLRPRFGTLGMIAMPNTWLFQLLFSALSPLADVLCIVAFVRVALVAHAHGATYARTDLEHLLTLYAAFLLTELATATLALFMEPDEDRRLAWLVLLQRFAYRQVMYWVVLRSIAAAIRGRVVGWGSLERKATVAPALGAALLVLLLSAPARAVYAQARAPISDARPKALASLPITEVPSSSGHTLALFWSGDGDWQPLTKGVAAAFASHGIAVVGLGSRTWLTSGGRRTLDDLTRDSEAVLRWYLMHWKRDRILLVGYSRGAGFQALLYERLPADLRAQVTGIALLGAEHDASFEFHLMDLVRTVHRPTDIPIAPALARIAGTPLVCVYGRDETDTVCPALDASRATIIARDGSHHFDGDWAAIADAILQGLQRADTR